MHADWSCIGLNDWPDINIVESFKSVGARLGLVFCLAFGAKRFFGGGFLFNYFFFGSGISVTRSFPEAGIGDDHDLVMMTFRVRLKKARKQISQG